MLCFRWFQCFLYSSVHQNYFPGSCSVFKLRLASLSHSGFTTFSDLWEGPGNWWAFSYYSLLICGMLNWLNSQDESYLTYLQFIIFFFCYRVLHINVSRWSFREIWVTASLLRPPGFSYVFLPILTIMWFGCSVFFLLSPELFSKPFGTVPSAPITSDIIITLVFHGFVSSLSRSFFYNLLCF